MAFIPAENTAQVRTQFSYDTQQCENVYYVLGPEPWDATNLGILAGVFKDWWEDNLKPVTPNALTLNRILARDMTVSSGPSIEYTTGLPLSGDSVTEALPTSCTISVKWTTGLAGRSFRGRTYHLGLADDAVVGNLLTSTGHTNLSNAYNGLLNAIVTADVDWGLVVASFFSGVTSTGEPIPRAAAVLTPILSAVIDNVIDSQRRRLPGRGA